MFALTMSVRTTGVGNGVVSVWIVCIYELAILTLTSWTMDEESPFAPTTFAVISFKGIGGTTAWARSVLRLSGRSKDFGGDPP